MVYKVEVRLLVNFGSAHKQAYHMVELATNGGGVPTYKCKYA